MSKELAAQLKAIRESKSQVNPDPSWVLENKKQLLSTITTSQETKEKTSFSANGLLESLSGILHIFVPNKLLLATRFSLTVFLVGIVAVGGWIASVSASQDSLPGEALYGVKLAAETTELLVATVIGSEEGKAATNLKHAAVKVEEFKKATNTKQAAASIKSLKKKIESANKSLEKTESKSPKQAVAIAKVVEEKTEEILLALGEKKDIIEPTELEKETEAGDEETENLEEIAEEEQESKDLTKEVGEVENLIQDTGVKAVEVLVKKKEDAEAGVNKEEVKEKIEKRIDRIVSEIEALDTELEETGILVSSSSTLSTIPVAKVVKEAETEEVTEEVVEENSSEEPEENNVEENINEEEIKNNDKEKTVKETVDEVGETTVEATKKAGETLVEVDSLIENDDLEGALQKVQELAEVKKTVKELVVEVKQVVNDAAKVVEEIENLENKEEPVDARPEASFDEVKEEMEDTVVEENNLEN